MTDNLAIPTEWTFKSNAVAKGFDSHVREQLPWYDLVTDAVAQIGRHYIGHGGLVYDIGASTGNIGHALEDTLTSREARLVAIEESPEMAACYAGPGTVEVARAESYQFERFDFAVAMLTFMFLRPADVPILIGKLADLTNPGGALVVVDKMLPPRGYLSTVTSRLTLAAKVNAGVRPEQIIAKELSLAGAQRPIDPYHLTTRGAVEWFRFGDFAGYVLEART